ncbi:MAG: sensor histidine kinase [Gemmobacter sp.]
MRAARLPAPNLRRRLFLMIVGPLVVIALAAGAVRYRLALELSNRLHDDTLTVVAHAVAREVVLTKGDVLADALLNSLVGALGDPIYYQVRAANGRVITGHSDAPPLPAALDLPGGRPVFHDATYAGRPVRAVSMREFIADPEIDGWTTVTVWQTLRRREAVGLQLLTETALILGGLLSTAAVLVWIGITLGLRPLTELRDAVARRSEHDLQPIRRPVPAEAQALVATINALFARLTAELERRDAFIANAAHQLRNPVAAIRAQAEAALSTPDSADRAARLADLSDAAARLSRITRQLLRHDIATHARPQADAAPADLHAIAVEVARRHAPRAVAADVELALEAPDTPLPVRADPLLVAEAVDNLIDNALTYGARPGGQIVLTLTAQGPMARLSVADDGPGIPPDRRAAVFERFVRLVDDGGRGCGLGLPIARAVARAAGGDLQIGEDAATGCRMDLTLPMDRIAA